MPPKKPSKTKELGKKAAKGGRKKRKQIESSSEEEVVFGEIDGPSFCSSLLLLLSLPNVLPFFSPHSLLF
jgi:hypothetical protein